jgi:membrane-associated phospholipid phosphatase
MMKADQFFDLDRKLSKKLRLRQDHPLWPVAAILAHSGDSWFWLAGLILIWLVGGPGWHSRSAILILAVGSLAALVFLVKFTVRRQRPEGEWGAIYRMTDPHSFPSGHAARAFLLVVMVAALGPSWLFWVIVIWAPFVSLARVATGLHFFSDVVGGLVFGVVYGMLMLVTQPFWKLLLPFLF